MIAPCIPDEWPGFRVRLRLAGGTTQYEIAVDNPKRNSSAVVSVTADGSPVAVGAGSARVALVNDGGRHVVHVVLGAASADQFPPS